MMNRICIRGAVSFRNLLAILLISYMAFAMLLILHLSVDDTPDTEASPNPLSDIRLAGVKRELINIYRNHNNGSPSQQQDFVPKNNNEEQQFPKSLFNYTKSRFSQILNDFLDPEPVEIPQIAENHFGSFYNMHNDVFVYSAFLDDRKDEVFIRILTLTTQVLSKLPLYCYFSGEIFNVTRKGERYELCENHNRKFGGYIFSCQVPEFLDRPVSSHVVISWSQYGQFVTVPLLQIKPAKHKLNFLNSYVENDNKIKTNSSKINFLLQGNVPKLSFAICVPPLFGDISPHRLIEFIELSLLLGADHIFFYKYSISNDIFRVISHYVSRGVVTLLPWLLPRSVTPERIWYYGQLLTHNDCLYRAMSNFDLIALNDVDEFIVLHQNESKSWKEIFPFLLTNRTCGWSFQSAFYDPGIKDMKVSGVITPLLTARSSKLSKVRTKVMISPWRVFEVGIHHVSKQNREGWTVTGIDPSMAFLHHYRRCVANYDMSCQTYIRDSIIEERYGDTLRDRYNKSLALILK